MLFRSPAAEHRVEEGGKVARRSSPVHAQVKPRVGEPGTQVSHPVIMPHGSRALTPESTGPDAGQWIVFHTSVCTMIHHPGKARDDGRRHADRVKEPLGGLH